MKTINSAAINPFGGLNFVLEEFDRLSIGKQLAEHLPELAPQSCYSWRDILYSFWSIFFCGGDCIEDLATNLRSSFTSNPYVKLPSPDRVLHRLKELATDSKTCKTPRSKSTHEFNWNHKMSKLNLALFQKLRKLEDEDKPVVLDYDNTLIFTEKSDAKMTYKKHFGYAPGVAMIGKKIVYVENRNGNSAAHILQEQTLDRMFQHLKETGIRVDIFRADGASYQWNTVLKITQEVDTFYLRAKRSQSVLRAISTIKDWQEIELEGKKAFRGSVIYTPFESAAARYKQKDALQSYRLVVTKIPREDQQLDFFSGEAYNYFAILTNNYDQTNDEVVDFYNQRGAMEKEFDVLKNDFGWNHLPFSKLEQNTVYLIFTAICRNLYEHIIQLFAKKYEGLSPKFRIKKFIFRFITIPAKWIKTARRWQLRIYGNIHFKT